MSFKGSLWKVMVWTLRQSLKLHSKELYRLILNNRDKIKSWRVPRSNQDRETVKNIGHISNKYKGVELNHILVSTL